VESWSGALKLLAGHLHAQGKLNLDEAFVDATFASAKKRLCRCPTRRGKGTRLSLSPLVKVFLSPYLSKALRVLSASWRTRLLPEASSTKFRSPWSRH
jgi:hypothetical protein